MIEILKTKVNSLKKNAEKNIKKKKQQARKKWVTYQDLLIQENWEFEIMRTTDYNIGVGTSDL